MFYKFTKLDEMIFSQLIDVYEESILLEVGGRCYSRDRNAARVQAEQDLYSYLNDVFFATEGAWYAAWIEQGVYRSVLRIEPYRDGFLISGLETAPKFRKLGYAKNLIMAVLEEIDKPVYSHIEKRNMASIEVHRSCGFSFIHDFAVYLDGSVVSTSLTLRRMPGEKRKNY